MTETSNGSARYMFSDCDSSAHALVGRKAAEWATLAEWVELLAAVDQFPHGPETRSDSDWIWRRCVDQ